MTQEYASIEVKRLHGKMVVLGLGRTPKGQRYIKRTIVLNSPRIDSPDFKTEVAAAVLKLSAPPVLEP